jgi:DNA-binding transcriptional LysR family regulator
MDYRRLKYFVVVAQELHFRRAAARLHIAQPPLSQQIRKLEAELGVDLFHRERGRAIQLTDAGRALVIAGRRALEHADFAEEAARRAGRGEEGHLRIGFAPSAAIDVLPRIVRTFATRSPRITISLFELQSEDQVPELRSGELDAGLIRPLFGVDDLGVYTICEQLLVVAVPEGHRLATAPSAHFSELAQEPFVLAPRSAGAYWYDHILALCRASGFSPKIVQEVTTISTRLGLVAGGIGVSIFVGSAKALRRPGVVTIPLDSPPVPLLLAWRKESASAVLESFLSCARSIRFDSPEPEPGAASPFFAGCA